MLLSDPEGQLLCELLSRIAGEPGGLFLSGREAAGLPRGLFEALREAGILRDAEPSQMLECTGCERHCPMPVNVLPAIDDKPARAFIACDKPEDYGRIPVEFGLMRRWLGNRASLAQAISSLASLQGAPGPEPDGTYYLGYLPIGGRQTDLHLAENLEPRIVVATCNIPLTRLVCVEGDRLVWNQAFLDSSVQESHSEPTSGKGSKHWRKANASNAAHARHRQPGGSIDKQRAIQSAWQSGRYKTNRACIDAECARIGISPDSAAKALRNIPAPAKKGASA